MSHLSDGVLPQLKNSIFSLGVFIVIFWNPNCESALYVLESHLFIFCFFLGTSTMNEPSSSFGIAKR